jgi:hypothetical protein
MRRCLNRIYRGRHGSAERRVAVWKWRFVLRAYHGVRKQCLTRLSTRDVQSFRLPWSGRRKSAYRVSNQRVPCTFSMLLSSSSKLTMIWAASVPHGNIAQDDKDISTTSIKVGKSTLNIQCSSMVHGRHWGAQSLLYR